MAVNYYELLSIAPDCEQIEIRKAYRKKALECHPDKNPDNPKAAERFHELSKALEILTDEVARAAYDNVLKAKKAAELRNQLLDSKRRKLKTDLEQREREALNKLQATHGYGAAQKTDEEILEEQIKRLRQEGSKLLEEEQRLMREQLQRNLAEREQKTAFDSTNYRIKIKWKSDKNDNTNGGYSKEVLEKFLKKYGDINALAMSSKRGSALVEFKTQDAAEMAVSYEKGRIENPLQLSWVTPPTAKNRAAVNTAVNERDFEDLVMHKLRQAEERKRLIKQLEEQDNE